MKRDESPKACFRVIPEKRSDRLAVVKTAIRQGVYKVKAGGIAEKLLKESLFELALTLYNQKYQKCRNN